MVDFLVPDWPAPTHVRAVQTSRFGGVSRAPWESLNLGEHVGDNPASVSENRSRLRRQLPGEPVWLTQVHGNSAVDAAEVTKGYAADAIYSRQPGQVCAVMTADCLPVLLTDRAGSVVAAAHAGWRGLAAGILENTLAALEIQPGQALAWLGPAIGPQAFEVGDEVRAVFLAQDPAAGAAFRTLGGGKWLADIYALARLRLAAAGVIAISGGEYCTFTDSRRFFSYRRDGLTGRMASMIWIDRQSGV